MSLGQDIGRVGRRVLPQIARLILVLLPLLYVLSGFYSVGSEQRGVLYRFGAMVSDDIPPGMHYRLPWPLERVEIVATSTVRLLDVDFAEGVAAGTAAGLISSDASLVDLAYRLQYRVGAPPRFLTSARQPEALLREIARAEALMQVAEQPISTLLTTGRSDLQIRLRQGVQARADRLGLGLTVTGVEIRRLGPPGQVRGVFEQVAGARAERQQAIQLAQGQRSADLAAARASALRVLERARAAARERTEAALGDNERYRQILAAAEAAPEVIALRLYLDTLEQVLSRARLKVFPASEASAPLP